MCRVFTKKSLNRGYQASEKEDEEEYLASEMRTKSGLNHKQVLLDPKQHYHHHMQALYDHHHHNYSLDGPSLQQHLPQLFSPESATMDQVVECSQNLMRLTNSGASNNGCGLNLNLSHYNDDHWSFLDKLLASHNHHNVGVAASSTQKIPSSVHYLAAGCDARDIVRISK